jgi:RNase P protein component
MAAGRPEKAAAPPRKRPAAASSRHFTLSWRRAPSHTVDSQSPVVGRVGANGQLLLAIGKKLLPRAVDRNRVRRIAREAVRAAGESGSGLVVFLRLKSAPAQWAVLPDGQYRKACRAELDALLASLPGRTSLKDRPDVKARVASKGSARG